MATENGDPAGINAAITERRELRFSPAALQAMIGCRLARRVGARYVGLVFHVEPSHAPAPAVIESDVMRQGPVHQWR